MFWIQIILIIVPLVVLSNSMATLDLKLAPHECLETKAIAAEYDPLGDMVVIGNITVYHYDAVTNINRKRMLIGVHDIYGIKYDNLKQVADEMAIQSGGFSAVLPDFFRGDVWDVDRNASEREEWMARVGDWDGIIKPDLINIVNYYRMRGVEEFAIFGMCFGGGVATLAAVELSDLFKVSAIVHPSSVTIEQAAEVKIPMYLMPASNDADLLPFYEVLQTKFGDNSGHRRFDDVSHGFSGSRGNFSDTLIRERVNEVVTTLGSFFDRNLHETRVENSSPHLRPAGVLFMILMTSMLMFMISRN